jgi:capsular polysaccharide biosynthesis protein
MEESNSLTNELGKYIEVLFRQWQLILGAILVCAVSAAVVSFSQTKIYEARVLVASTKIASVVSFGSAIETLPEEQLSSRVVDLDARLQSYVQIVRNPRIAQLVIEEIGEKLPAEDRDILTLMSKVSGVILPKSDSIEIVVAHQDPDLSTAIANAWGEAYVRHVNMIYSSGGLNASYTAIQGQTEEAWEDYQSAEAEYVVFISDTRVKELSRQLAEQQSIIDSLSATRSLMISTIISSTMNAQLSVVGSYLQNLQEKLFLTYQEAQRVNQLLMDAQDMRDQVLNGGSGAASSNALALLLLKAQVFAANDEGLGNLQVQANLVDLTSEQMITDLAGLIRTLENRKVVLGEEINSLSQQLLVNGGDPSTLGLNAVESVQPSIDKGLASMQAFSELKGLEGVVAIEGEASPMEETIQELEKRVNDLQAQLSRETDRELELTRARDLAWETYKTLATKEAELRVAAQTNGTEVTVAAPAIAQGSGSNGIRNIQLAAVVGLILGVVTAYFIEFWWNYKGLDPTPITIIPFLRKKNRKRVGNLT